MRVKKTGEMESRKETQFAIADLKIKKRDTGMECSQPRKAGNSIQLTTSKEMNFLKPQGPGFYQ